jgi:hypothetical protein
VRQLSRRKAWHENWTAAEGPASPRSSLGDGVSIGAQSSPGRPVRKRRPQIRSFLRHGPLPTPSRLVVVPLSPRHSLSVPTPARRHPSCKLLTRRYLNVFVHIDRRPTGYPGPARQRPSLVPPPPDLASASISHAIAGQCRLCDALARTAAVGHIERAQ